jgi:acyl carrier protein
MNIEQKVEQILRDLTDNEYRELFSWCTTTDEKLQLLPSESLLALMFITALEDEFGISFDDDVLDIDFFSSMNLVVSRINNTLNQTV